MKFLSMVFVLCLILGITLGEISNLRAKRHDFGRPGFGGPGFGRGPSFRSRGPTVVTKTVTKTEVIRRG
ncbi:hypothetical protein DdX_10126 [Ditylenchus destructor]|uniref:Uncharacterized protein n=1 Tax=Ditylenchus destructor TaxID=166010 RepID=A0AAD4MZJ5_9BILA|nr:hypothetical protein DdX_10126 [Ditylenchus destructor]